MLEADSNEVYANGSLLFARGTLLAQPVNERSMRAVGNAVPLAENVLRDSVLGKAVFSASQTGRLVFQGGFDVVESRLVWLSRNGQEVGVLQDMCACSWPRISHDGRRAAVSITDPTTGNADIWVYEIGGGRRLHLTFDAAYEMNPTWAADDGAVFFTSTRTGVRNIHRIDSRNRGAEEVLSESEDEEWVQSTSVDGRWLVFYKVPKKRNSFESGDLWLLPLTAGRRSEPEPLPDG